MTDLEKQILSHLEHVNEINDRARARHSNGFRPLRPTIEYLEKRHVRLTEDIEKALTRLRKAGKVACANGVWFARRQT